MNINNLLSLLFVSSCSIALSMELESLALITMHQKRDISSFTKELIEESSEIEIASELLFELFNKGNKQYTYEVYNNEATTKLLPQNKVNKNVSGICQYCSKRIKCLRLHIYRQHGKESTLVNRTKQYAADNLSQFMENNHSRTFKRTRCPYEGCGKSFTAQSLWHHIRNIHGEGARKVRCSYCPQSITAYCLKTHIKNVHPGKK